MEKTAKTRGNIPRKIKGFRDSDPSLSSLKQQIITNAAKVYQSYGFEHWDTPVLEYADCLGKYMPDEDTVDKGVYSFKNPEIEPVLATNGTEIQDEWGQVLMENHFLSLRYDLTAPLARVYAERLWKDYIKGQLHEGKTPLFRRYQYGPVYRYEIKVEPGRYREFWQIDFDTVGSSEVAADAEAAIILMEALEAVGMPRDTFSIKVNNRKMLKGFLQSIGVNEEEQEQAILRVVDKYDKIGKEAVIQELGPGREERSGAKIKGLRLDNEIISNIADFLDHFGKIGSRQEILTSLDTQLGGNELAREGFQELVRMDEMLQKLGYNSANIQFDPTLIRGMAYYTGPVFEAVSNLKFKDKKGQKRKVGAICGGGRYDGLVEKLLGMKVPATGASIGVDRLAAILPYANAAKAAADGPVFVVLFDDEMMSEYQLIAQRLRSAGIPTEVFYGTRKALKKQLSYADKKNCRIAILLGSNEFEKGVVTVRNLKLGKSLANEITDKTEWRNRVQKEVPNDQLVEYVQDQLNLEIPS